LLIAPFAMDIGGDHNNAPRYRVHYTVLGLLIDASDKHTLHLFMRCDSMVSPPRHPMEK